MKQKNNNENISKDRKKYIRKIKIRKLEILFTQITIIIAFISIWEILANKGKIDSFIMSQPSRILKTFLNLTSNNLLEHLKITIIETLLGFYYCNNFMVVTIYIKSIRTIFSCIK